MLHLNFGEGRWQKLAGYAATVLLEVALLIGSAVETNGSILAYAGHWLFYHALVVFAVVSALGIGLAIKKVQGYEITFRWFRMPSVVAPAPTTMSAPTKKRSRANVRRFQYERRQRRQNHW